MSNKPMMVCYDTQSCIKCYACVINCSAENRARLQTDKNIDVTKSYSGDMQHLNYLTIEQSEKGTFPNAKSVVTLKHCNHCEKPECVDVCPVKAIKKEESGAVVIDQNLCIGCQACRDVCPYNIPIFSKETGRTYKCIMCNDRLKAGLQTACSSACPSVAMFSGDAESVKAEAIKRAKHYEEVHGKKFIVYGLESVGSTVGKLSFITIAPEDSRDEYLVKDNVSSGSAIARDVIKIGGVVGIAAVGGAVGLHVNHWLKNKDNAEINKHDDEGDK